MIVAIMQPTYLPWVGYFNLINKSEYLFFWMMFNLIKDLGNKEIKSL